jgi:hypothetical protein
MLSVAVGPLRLVFLRSHYAACINVQCHSIEWQYAVIMLSVIIQSVVMLSIVILSIIVPRFVLKSVLILSPVKTRVVKLNTIM